MSKVQAQTRLHSPPAPAGAPLTLHIERLVLDGLGPDLVPAQFVQALQGELQSALQGVAVSWQGQHVHALPASGSVRAAHGAGLARQVAHSVTQQLSQHCAAPGGAADASGGAP